MHSNLPSAAAAARRLHASHAPREHQQLVFAWCLRRARLASRRGGERAKQHPSSAQAAPKQHP
eukprot:3362904-Lingulodinium_polyedra.AAC.1